MNFLAPLWLAAAGAAALGAVALHFITTQRPPASPLPTARFVPQGDARASSRAARPTDLLLLLLRCAAILLLGAAFAGPVTHARGTSLARVILVDRSRGSLADVRDSALAVMRSGDGVARGADVVVLFDSSATIVTSGAADSLGARAARRARGSLTAGLVTARRAAADLSQRADSVELVIVSPLTADEIDAASAGTIERWPGRARLVRTAAAPATNVAVALVSGDPDDALRPAIRALNYAAPNNAARNAGRAGTAVPVRVLRARLVAADSAAAREGAAVVLWPHAGTTMPTAQGLWAGNATIVAPLERLPLPQVAGDARVVARWADGAPAAIESALGRGCVRTIGVGVPNAGDVTLQPAFMAVAHALLAPCDGSNVSAAVADSTAGLFARPGPAAPAAALRPDDDRSPLAPWLLGGALLLLIGELFARRGSVETVP
jgi:aerotolerance regulator-like protein